MEESLDIDIEKLLSPISDQEFVVGEDFRDSVDPESSYLTLKDRRADARASERASASGENGDSSPLNAARGQWAEICDLADRLLRERTKDLEVACWYCEGLVRLSGFSGLAGGLELLARLVETYWDEGLYPQADEDGLETRLAPLFGLIGRGVAGSLVQPIKLLPLSDRSDVEPAALWTLELAFAPVRSEAPESRERQNERSEALVQSIARSTPQFIRAIRRKIDEALANLDRLMRALEAKAGVAGFSTQVAEPLQAIARVLDDRASHLLLVEEPLEAETSGAEVDGAAPTAREKRLSDREDALALLAQAAAYFEAAEPQSLIGRSIREVVRRARLTLGELMVELLPDEQARSSFLLRSGIRDDSNQ